MLKKSALLMAVASSAGFPYLLSSKPQEASEQSTVAAYNPAAGEHAAAPAARGSIGPSQAPVSLTPDDARIDIQPLAAVFRWEITPAWVMSQWSRVSTGLADLDLHGYRVALVSGTSEGDLAGSLTYYFNTQQRLQRITFQGSTGDARQLAYYLSAVHHLAPEPTNDPSLQLFRVRNGRTVLSELRIKAAAVVRRTSGLSRYNVNLFLERPSSLD
jgi:hypothetical protein